MQLTRSICAVSRPGSEAKGVQWRKFGLLLYYYWHRNFGTAMSWFVWDFAFYVSRAADGARARVPAWPWAACLRAPETWCITVRNPPGSLFLNAAALALVTPSSIKPICCTPQGNKLFQGTFIKIINPSASLIQVLEWTLLNSSVALVGYYFAAFTVDKPWMGRMRMQVMGFAWMVSCENHCSGLPNRQAWHSSSRVWPGSRVGLACLDLAGSGPQRSPDSGRDSVCMLTSIANPHAQS